MHPLEIRESRFKFQKQIAGLEDGPEKAALEAHVAELQADCPHEHPEEDPAKGWRCRDCDLLREPEPEPEEEPAEAALVEETAAGS
jgi:hypothetical protein